jgi:hypothetical protein
LTKRRANGLPEVGSIVSGAVSRAQALPSSSRANASYTEACICLRPNARIAGCAKASAFTGGWSAWAGGSKPKTPDACPDIGIAHATKTGGKTSNRSGCGSSIRIRAEPFAAQ